MGSNPIIGTLENAILLWEIIKICDFIGREMTRTKAHEKTAYLSSIRQVRPTNFRIFAGYAIHEHEASFWGPPCMRDARLATLELEKEFTNSDDFPGKLRKIDKQRKAQKSPKLQFEI